LLPQAITLGVMSLKLYVLRRYSTKALSGISAQENDRHFGVGSAWLQRWLSLPGPARKEGDP
jgi:hypothetical protein